MRRFIYLSLCLLCCLTMVAQPRYKNILQELPQQTDREAYAHLYDYHEWFPTKPHPYYLMGNIELRLLPQEHALIDYVDRHLCLYNAHVYFGLCRARMKNDKINADYYPLAAVDGKVNEDILTRWLQHKEDSTKIQLDCLEELYAAYTQMVNHYDTCLQQFTEFCQTYNRLSDARLMLKESDRQRLRLIQQMADQVARDQQRFQQALLRYPIPDYQPCFSLVPIQFYRIDGLTNTHFIQSQVRLWDYAAWVRDFLTQQEQIDQLRWDMSAEQERLNGALQQPHRFSENTVLLNRIRRYDETSPVADLLHLDYLTAYILSEQQSIMSDSLNADNWLTSLQRYYRLQQRLTESEALTTPLPTRLGTADVSARYTDFLRQFYPEQGALTAEPTRLLDRGQSAVRNLQQWLVQNSMNLPHSVQISDALTAQIQNDQILFVRNE